MYQFTFFSPYNPLSFNFLFYLITCCVLVLGNGSLLQNSKEVCHYKGKETQCHFLHTSTYVWLQCHWIAMKKQVVHLKVQKHILLLTAFTLLLAFMNLKALPISNFGWAVAAKNLKFFLRLWPIFFLLSISTCSIQLCTTCSQMPAYHINTYYQYLFWFYVSIFPLIMMPTPLAKAIHIFVTCIPIISREIIC